MSTKALFIAAMGGTLFPFGAKTTITDSSVSEVTATGHGYQTGAGPFKIMNSLTVDTNLTAAVHAEGLFTVSSIITTDVAEVNGTTYQFLNTILAADDVLVTAGATAITDAEAMANLAAAINQNQTGGTAYNEDTVGDSEAVSAFTTDSLELTIQARTLEAVVGNAITISSIDSTITASGALLTGGADGDDYFLIRVDDNTLSLATSKVNAEAGTAVVLASDTTGVSQLVPTIETLAESLDDVIANYLTVNGARSQPASFSVPKAWRGLITGLAADFPSQ